MSETKVGASAPRPRGQSWIGEFKLARAAEGVMSAAILLVSLVPLARFIGIAFARVGYPFDLEWCEGGTIGHIRVVLAGQQIYRKPSFEFTPYLYPPLYYYVAVLPSLVLGAGHLAPRLLSLVSILGFFVLLGRWVRDETGDPIAGIAAIGVFSATYQLTGFWFDIARVDAFFLFLVFASHMTARAAKTPRRAALVGALIASACFTKQLGIPLAVPALVVLAMRRVRLGVVAGLVAGALVGGAAVALNVRSSGWFYYYVLDLPSRHEIQWYRFGSSARTYFLGVTFPMTLAGVAILCGSGFGRSQRKAWFFHALFIALACSTSFLPFLKTGGYPNGLIPAYAALALASGLGVGALRRARFASALGTVGPRLLACLVLVIQYEVLDYDPKDALPTAADLTANQKVVARLERLPKPIFVTGSSYYTMMAGQEGVMTDTMGLIDVFKGGGPEAGRLSGDLTHAFRSHRFKTIVLDRVAGFLPENFVGLIHREYASGGSVLEGLPPDVIWPKCGFPIRPDTVWVAR